MAESTKQIISNLTDDNKYYGEYGQQFLSNSDILNLLKFPEKFKVPQPKTKAMVEGSYFHTAILEPNKIKDFKIIDVASRSTKSLQRSLWGRVKYYYYKKKSFILIV